MTSSRYIPLIFDWRQAQLHQRARITTRSSIIDLEFLQARRLANPKKSQHHGAKAPKIESNIPCPPSNRGLGGSGNRSRVRKGNSTHFYPFEWMEVGDSFWVKAHKDGKMCSMGAAKAFEAKTGWRFASRAQSRDGTPNAQVEPRLRGTRVWRIE